VLAYDRRRWPRSSRGERTIEHRPAKRAGIISASATALAALLLSAAGASAFLPLPSGAQVNDDPAAGIIPSLSVSGEDPANADVVGGALTAGKVAVPWAIFRQQESGGAHDQIFVRSFAGGAWTTRGTGTVGGRSSLTPTFPGSLNFDQGQDGEAPSIEFAGAGRTVPWASWYEDTSGAGFGTENVFASRFDNSGDASQGKWIFGGQSRGLGGGTVEVPSLNIDTEKDAENPSIAGGSAVDPTKPGPWVTWQEVGTGTGETTQIYVERSIGPGSINCNGVTPKGVANGKGEVPAIGGFCWQQVGIPRAGEPPPEPSLNVDPTREGEEPDITFTGANDAVPWVVWYETGVTATNGPGKLRSNDMIFAAKATSDGVSENGGFHWTAVGHSRSATLDTSGTNNFGACGESANNEAECSLNSSPSAEAEDPQVAAGTMQPGVSTVPWVAWQETVGTVKQIFVSRLVEGHFVIANNGKPVSEAPGGATRPAITFSGNTPYVSWHQAVSGQEVAFLGHLVTAANPTFVLDEADVPISPSSQAEVRDPLGSSCADNPFDGDGSACQGGALGTPFFLYTDGSGPLSLLAGAYAPEAPVSGDASAIGETTATVSGSVDPRGGPVRVFFEYGPTNAYGQSTAVQTLPAADGGTGFTAALAGLAPGATVHYRAVAVTDFETLTGVDRFLETKPPPSASAKAARATVKGATVSVRLTCKGPTGLSCKLAAQLVVKETLRGKKLVGVSASLKHKLLTVGSVSLTLAAGQSRVVKVSLNRTGRRLLAHRRHRRLAVQLRVLERPAGTASKASKTLETQVLTLRGATKKPAHKRR
jgi:hypothetical protein